MHDVVISLGSNIGPEENIPLALTHLDELLFGTTRAEVYHTEPINRPEQPMYWNTAIRGQTNLDQNELKEVLMKIESDLGRVRESDRYAARQIDLDEIWRDGRVTDSDVENRLFLLWCLRDLQTHVG